MSGPRRPRRGDVQALVGRGDDLAAIDAFLDQVAAGGSVLLLSGEPGVGKTVMLDAAAEAAAVSGMRVLRAGGAEFEADLGFSGLHQVCLPLRDEIGQLDPADRDALSVALGLSGGMPSDRLTVSRAVLALLHRVATAHPVVVIIDDLPWLDRPSGVVLGLVARRLAGSRTGLLAASRSGAESFFERGGLPARELAPLSDADARQLLAARFPHLPDRVQARLLGQARGNPLALLELPRALSERRPADVEVLPAVPPSPSVSASCSRPGSASCPGRPGAFCCLLRLRAPVTSAFCRVPRAGGGKSRTLPQQSRRIWCTLTRPLAGWCSGTR